MKTFQTIKSNINTNLKRHMTYVNKESYIDNCQSARDRYASSFNEEVKLDQISGDDQNHLEASGRQLLENLERINLRGNLHLRKTGFKSQYSFRNRNRKDSIGDSPFKIVCGDGGDLTVNDKGS